MNQTHLVKMLEHFNLGQPIHAPQRVHGGLLHIMWHIDTSNGSYAVKQLSKNINLNDEKVVRNYELTECIAHQFANKGIPAVYAISKNGKHLFIVDNSGYLLYPWIDAKVLGQDAINQTRALEIACILAKIHLINLNLNDLDEPEFDIHSNQSLMELVDLAERKKVVFSDYLQNNLNNLLNINENYLNAIAMLNGNIVISHGDLDQKNVMWTAENKPLLIDWESARKLNPTYEIINAALDWSGITTKFDIDLFRSMIKSYKDAEGIIDKESIDAAFWGVLGNWINWTVYNIKRVIEPQNIEEKKLGEAQVLQVLPIILNIYKIKHDLINEINGL
ncbi:MAG: phosphotransferase [Proteobacteria bacterium]|nr:phosphotransferase [Pseudomonadota bacterium]